MANCTTGGGYENEKYYQTCKISFLNIENIHAVRDSLNSTNDILTNNENSKWLEHIRGILDGVNKITYLINRDSSVLCHCSDGWDRTAQVNLFLEFKINLYLKIFNYFNLVDFFINAYIG